MPYHSAMDELPDAVVIADLRKEVAYLTWVLLGATIMLATVSASLLFLQGAYIMPKFETMLPGLMGPGAKLPYLTVLLTRGAQLFALAGMLFLISSMAVTLTLKDKRAIYLNLVFFVIASLISIAIWVGLYIPFVQIMTPMSGVSP